jgi:branched-chain amino acid transport system substrate-binding protein
MRRLKRFIGAMAGSLALLMGGVAMAQEPVKIGVLLPFTGPFAKSGLEAWAAMEIARDMINEKGGVRGAPVEFVRGDAVNPNAGISEAERIVKSGVKITTGTFASPLAIAVSQASERNGAVHWETTGAADVITKRGFKRTFQVGPGAVRYGRAALDFARQVVPGKLGKTVATTRIALLWENRAFGKSVGDGVRDYAKELGIQLVYDEGYDQFMTDMTPLVQRLKDAKPDIVIAISFLNDAILFQRKARELDFNTGAFIGVSAGYSAPDLKDALGDLVNGIFVADFPARVNPAALREDIRAVDAEFFRRYQDRQKREPAGHAVATFAALWTLFNDVLPKARSMEPDDIRAAAMALNLPEGSLINGSGVKFTDGDWASDPKDVGQNLRSAIGVWQWQAQAARQIYPPNLAVSEPRMLPMPNWNQR